MIDSFQCKNTNIFPGTIDFSTIFCYKMKKRANNKKEDMINKLDNPPTENKSPKFQNFGNNLKLSVN